MTVYKVVFLLSNSQTYVKTFGDAETRDTFHKEISEVVANAVPILSFDNDIPPNCPVDSSMVTLRTAHIVAIERQDCRV